MGVIELAENGNQGGLMQNLQLLVPLVIIIVLGILMRRRQGARTNLEVAVGLFSDSKYNLKVLNVFSTTTPSFKKLKTGNWKKNQAKIGFLEQELQNNLTSAFALALDYNDRLARAKQQRSTSYMLGVDTARLGDALTKSQEALRVWIQENYRTEMFRRRRGLFG